MAPHEGALVTPAQMPPVLVTGATGGIGLETFLKPVTIQRLTEAGLASLRPTVEALAAAEGMPAHAAAVRR